MPKRRLERLRERSLEELHRQLNEINTEYMKLNSLIKAGGTPEKPGRIKQLRKERARILTILNERKIH